MDPNPKPAHPLHQIASNPTHKLLLKQWLKEQDLILTRISLRQTQLDSARTHLAALHALFFLFHSAALLLLFSAAGDPSLCRRSWVPSLCSLACSIGLIWAVRHKSGLGSRLERILEREEEDSSLLGKCVEELRRKGSDFDLMREVDALRRAKSLRVVERRPGRRWSGRDVGSLFLLAVSCLVLGLIRVVLCG
ncbi:hypothetical protein STAS_13996 [Striga asiatica]|uniref:Uncharacterized protein n=1 Tax=Striga asiatica TaxID=4170 RepID=A0A5A7PXG6_STRAF|nr:hypothetical protein STAS_13996 [Striga asiatica]